MEARLRLVDVYGRHILCVQAAVDTTSSRARKKQIDLENV
jgi:hypothetical protein